MIRTVFGAFFALVATAIGSSAVVIGALLGRKDTVGSIFDITPRVWGKALVWAAGIEIVVHGEEHTHGAEKMFVSNHVSLFDVPVIASLMTRGKFVAKAELSRIPLFGAGIRAAGMVFIERENRKAAFESYREASDRVHDGASIIVFAEGTRGDSYALRAFKKGPFVLAISAQASIIPTVIYGTIHCQPKGKFLLRKGRVDVHFLEPVPTVGLTYEQRGELAATVRGRMAEALELHYGVKSPGWEPRSLTTK